MRWTVAAPFFKSESTSYWIDDFAISNRHTFVKIAAYFRDKRSWHSRKERATPLSQWRDYYRQASNAVKNGDGVITVFPQLAVCAGIANLLHRRKVPIIAWCFNVGAFPSGIKRLAASLALSQVNKIVVHSRAEVDAITTLFKLDPGIVEFVPLQRAPIEELFDQDKDYPYIISMGSANRDYLTLVNAVKLLDVNLVIVAAARCLEGITIPSNVKVMSDLTSKECQTLVQKARFSVVPLSSTLEASGQVTVIEAMCMNRAVIATRSIGTEDYIDDETTGSLVAPGDVDSLKSSIQKLWDSPEYCDFLASNAAQFASSSLSDQAAAKSLIQILDDVMAQLCHL